MRVFVDSSAIAALIIKNDANHQQSLSSYRAMIHKNAELIISNFIIAETFNLIASRTYPGKAREWILNNTWPVERVTTTDEKKAIAIINKFSDKNYSYTDATSFSLIERLDLDLAFTFDRHFTQYGIKTHQYILD